MRQLLCIVRGELRKALDISWRDHWNALWVRMPISYQAETCSICLLNFLSAAASIQIQPGPSCSIIFMRRSRQGEYKPDRA